MKHTLLVCALLGGVGVAHAQMATYAIDPAHTFVYFEADHFGISTLRGRFDKKTGTVSLDKAAKAGSADIVIDVNSLSTGVAPLDAHLKSKDFFNAAQISSAKFSANRFSFDGDKVSEVAGTLTLLGTTQPVTLKAKHFKCLINPLLKREVCGGDFETTVARSQFGMAYGVESGLPDNVRLLIQIEAIKQ
jgi:polyisoprenoid-binding protein YceI